MHVNTSHIDIHILVNLNVQVTFHHNICFRTLKTFGIIYLFSKYIDIDFVYRFFCFVYHLIKDRTVLTISVLQ